ncbi:MAG: hypothetical protein JKY13_03085 [Gammaproteobacteria bacterium]|nr:hypothetical protein [Gammaproteobacteria bacterium]
MLKDAKQLSIAARDLLLHVMGLLKQSLEYLHIAGDNPIDNMAQHLMHVMRQFSHGRLKSLKLSFPTLNLLVIKQFMALAQQHITITTIDLRHPKLQLTSQQKNTLQQLLNLINQQRQRHKQPTLTLQFVTMDTLQQKHQKM